MRLLARLRVRLRVDLEGGVPVCDIWAAGGFLSISMELHSFSIGFFGFVQRGFLMDSYINAVHGLLS